MPVDTDNGAATTATTTTTVEPFTVTITLGSNIRADELAAELRKMRDALARAYRDTLTAHNVPVYHPAMQGIAAASINLEGVIQVLDPPRVQMAGPGGVPPNPFIPGAGRA